MARKETLTTMLEVKLHEVEELKKMLSAMETDEESELEDETLMTAEGIDTETTTKAERAAIEEKDYEEHTPISRDRLKELLSEKLHAGFRDEVKALLLDNGAATLSALSDEKLSTVYFAAEKIGV